MGARSKMEKLLNKAKAAGFKVYQNNIGQWIIKGAVNKKLWILQEQKQDSWLVTFDELSPMSLCTEKSLEALNLFIKYTRFNEFNICK